MTSIEELCKLITTPEYRLKVRKLNPHIVKPKLIPMLHRYQCDAMNCKRFIYYSEEPGIKGGWQHWAPRG